MPDKPPSSLTDIGLPQDSDTLYIQRGSNVYACTLTNFYSWLNGSTKLPASYVAAPTLAGNAGERMVVNMAGTALVLSSSLAAPTIAAGAGAGTGPTVSVASSSDGLSGQLLITTGTSPAGSLAIIATITYAAAFAVAPVVMLTPGNSAAAGLSGTTQVWPSLQTTGFVLKSGAAALSASAGYVWNYQILA